MLQPIAGRQPRPTCLAADGQGDTIESLLACGFSLFCPFCLEPHEQVLVELLAQQCQLVYWGGAQDTCLREFDIGLATRGRLWRCQQRKSISV